MIGRGLDTLLPAAGRLTKDEKQKQIQYQVNLNAYLFLFRQAMRHLFFISVLLVAGMMSAKTMAQNTKDSVRKDTLSTTEPKKTTDAALPHRTGESEPVRQSVDPVTGRLTRVRYKTPGYRIQVYTGTNNRASKQAALQMKEKVQKSFPELSVYIHFQSPRWICRVGDFISREEALPYLKKIRRERISSEARIVSSIILRGY